MPSWLKELRERFNWKKQAVDQTAHFLWAFLAVYVGHLFGGTPGFIFLAANIFIIGYREGVQGKSSRWWDKPMDVAFFAFGGITAEATYGN